MSRLKYVGASIVVASFLLWLTSVWLAFFADPISEDVSFSTYGCAPDFSYVPDCARRAANFSNGLVLWGLAVLVLVFGFVLYVRGGGKIPRRQRSKLTTSSVAANVPQS